MKKKILPEFVATRTYLQNFLEVCNRALATLATLLKLGEQTEQYSFFSCQVDYMLQALALDQHHLPFKLY